MTTARLLSIAWSPDPSVIGGSLALVVGYVVWLRGRLGLRSVLFFAGIAALLGALVTPIDRIGELYLFSVHMLQHMLLLLVVPPLLLWGLPPEATRALLRIRLVRRLERGLGRPAVALPVMVITLLAWHLPSLYGAALVDERVHALEHLLFLVTATMFWWPVLTPLRADRLTPPNAMMYLFGAMASISILGIIITFAPVPLYRFYVHPADPYGALHLIRDGWGVSVLADQQMGGVLMWIVGGIAYIVSILTEFGLWFSGPDVDELPTAPDLGRPGAVPAGLVLSTARSKNPRTAQAATHEPASADLRDANSHSTPRSSRHDGLLAVTALEGAG
jgi:cytochrome c oxidase assembly factor CtaG